MIKNITNDKNKYYTLFFSLVGVFSIFTRSSCWVFNLDELFLIESTCKCKEALELFLQLFTYFLFSINNCF